MFEVINIINQLSEQGVEVILFGNQNCPQQGHIENCC